VGALFRELVAGDTLALGTATKSRLFYLAAALGLNKFSAVYLYRLSSRWDSSGKVGKLFTAAAYRWNAIMNGCDISPGADIGPGLYLPHPTGVVIGPVRAGRNLTVLQNATLGIRDRALDLDDPANYPAIGHDVLIGPGAAVLGAVAIGDGARVGANTVVLSDIPAGLTARGVAARIA
jgi:serine O-acetyltransferase